MPASLSVRRLAALFAVLAAVSACTVVVEEDEPRSGPQFCTREYEPVCGRRGDERRTFANSCLADQAGYRVVRDGQCRGDRDDQDGGPRVCTREYDPVCGRRGRDRRTFGNECEAESAGYRVVRGGECRDGRDDDDDNDAPAFCTREYAPVCGRRGRDVRTFGNACEAEAADYRVIADGEC